MTTNSLNSNNFSVNEDNYIADICIIGAGPVGLFAAFEAGMHGMNAIIIDSLDFVGGQCSALYPQKPIYDIPAFSSISAQGLIDNLKQQADKFNPRYIFGNKVIDINQFYNENQDKNSIQNGVIITTDKGLQIKAKTAIIAAGCGFFGPNKPPLQNIEKYENKSVFYLVSDKHAFAGKNIAIAGGGDSAVDWAIELCGIANKVFMIHRRDKFRAMNDSINKMQKLVADGKIELVIPYSLKSINGNEASGTMQNIALENLNSEEKVIDAQYLLAFFGLTSDFGPLKNCGLAFDGLQIAVEPSTMQTSLPNIFAIGDACTYKNKLKLILTGFAEAALAVHQIKPIVFPGKVFNFEYSTTTLAG